MSRPCDFFTGSVTPILWKMVIPAVAVPGEGYIVDTSGAPVTVNLPPTPVDFAQVIFVDRFGTFDVNNLTLGANGNNIMGLAEDCNLSIPYRGAMFMFIADDINWIVNYLT